MEVPEVPPPTPQRPTMMLIKKKLTLAPETALTMTPTMTLAVTPKVTTTMTAETMILGEKTTHNFVHHFSGKFILN